MRPQLVQETYIARSGRCRPWRDAQAEVAELVDALGSGLSWGNPVEVRVLSSAPDSQKSPVKAGLFCVWGFLPTRAEFPITGVPQCPAYLVCYSLSHDESVPLLVF